MHVSRKFVSILDIGKQPNVSNIIYNIYVKLLFGLDCRNDIKVIQTIDPVATAKEHLEVADTGHTTNEMTRIRAIFAAIPAALCSP